MSRIDRETVEHVATLAKINLTQEDSVKLQTELESILNFADKLNELDVMGILPTTHAVFMKNVLRTDIRENSFDRDSLLANAPEHDGECFIVPKVVE